MVGASCDTPRVCGALFGLARGQICRWVVLCLLDSNGGMRVAWVWRLHKTYKTYKTYKIMVGGAM